MTALLRARGLTVAFPVAGAPRPVVDDLDIDIDEGEALAVVGESGSGKSTLGLLLLGLLAIFGVIRPALRRIPAPPPASGSAAVVANDVQLPPPTPALNQIGPNEDLLRLARGNPATVANVVRGWVNS